jgi:hypothetical protein
MPRVELVSLLEVALRTAAASSSSSATAAPSPVMLALLVTVLEALFPVSSTMV